MYFIYISFKKRSDDWTDHVYEHSDQPAFRKVFLEVLKRALKSKIILLGFLSKNFGKSKWSFLRPSVSKTWQFKFRRKIFSP